MMDPNQQLALMQAMGGYGYNRPAAVTSGTDALFQSINMMGGLPGSAIGTMNYLPNISPLGGLGFESFGSLGQMVSLIGGQKIASMMQNQGMLPTGNAGSYMQALQARDLFQQQQKLAGMLSPLDQQSMFNTFKGVAATLGVPFGEEQQQAARQMASTLSKYSPFLAALQPGILDALTGPTGSSQALASQLMQANRYQMDPYSGKLGFSAEANAAVANSIFKDLYSTDNIVRMQGIKAGELGEFYRNLSPEGLVGPSGNVRTRTLNALLDLRSSGADLNAIGVQAGLTRPEDLQNNLTNLSNQDLAKLRQNDTVREKLTSVDTQQIKQTLQSYVDSLGAMRELFGENGDPNAPMSKLIQGVKAFSGGQMQKFEANQLASMVRDVQALSQMSGKSLDQMFRMQQEAIAAGNAVPGLQGNMTNFAPTALNVGVTTGMAFNRVGAATGFGALTREQAEQGATRLFTRTLGSDMSNMLGALGRVDSAGGFANNAAGQDLRAILEAARTPGQTTYRASDGTLKNIPTRDMDIVNLVNQGGVEGMNAATFRMFLGDRTANLRSLSQDPTTQQAAMRMVNAEIRGSMARNMSPELISANALAQLDPKLRGSAALDLSRDALQTLLVDMTPQELMNDKTRNQKVSDVLKATARNYNVDLTDAQALNMAAAIYGSAEAEAIKFGADTLPGLSQIIGGQINKERTTIQMQTNVQSQLNRALSAFGTQGSVLDKLGAAVTKQGIRGEKADLVTLLGDLVGSNVDVLAENLSGPMQSIGDRYKTIIGKIPQLEGATPDQAIKIYNEILPQIKMLESEVKEAQTRGIEYGLLDQSKVFNLQDLASANVAATEIEKVKDKRNALLANNTATFTQDELDKIADDKITKDDLNVLARMKAAENVESIKQSSIDSYRNSKDFIDYSQKLKSVNPNLSEDKIFEAYQSNLIRQQNAEENLTKIRNQQSSAFKELDIDRLGKLTTEQKTEVLRNRRGILTPERSKTLQNEINNQFISIEAAFDELSSDPMALLRGGAVASQALETAVTARTNLTGTAANYFSGDFGAMILGNFSDAANKKLLQDKAYSGTLAERQNQLKQQIEQDYNAVNSAIKNLSGSTEKTYKSVLAPTEEALAYNPKNPEGMQALLTAAKLNDLDFKALGFSSPSELSDAVMSGKLIPGATPEQQKVLDTARGLVDLKGMTNEQLTNLDKISRITGQDFTDIAAKLKISKEDAVKYVQSGQINLGDVKVRDKNQIRDIREIYNQKLTLAEALKADNLSDEERKQLNNRLGVASDRLTGMLADTKLKETNLDDQLNQQEALIDLNKLKSDFSENATGIDLNTILTYGKADKKVKSDVARLSRLSSKDNLVRTLASGIGITDFESEEFKTLTASMSDASTIDLRNKKLLGDALLTVNNLKGFDPKLSGLDKLKQLSTDTDFISNIAKANPAISETTLQDIIKNTKAFDLENLPEKNRTEYLLNKFQDIQNIDVQTEREKDKTQKMEIVSGTLNVQGDIVGTASLSDVTGLLRV